MRFLIVTGTLHKIGCGALLASFLAGPGVTRGHCTYRSRGRAVQDQLNHVRIQAFVGLFSAIMAMELWQPGTVLIVVVSAFLCKIG